MHIAVFWSLALIQKLAGTNFLFHMDYSLVLDSHLLCLDSVHCQDRNHACFHAKASEAVQVLKFTTSSQQVSIHVTKFHTTIVKYHHSKMSMHYAWLITQFIHQFFILVTVEAYDEN